MSLFELNMKNISSSLTQDANTKSVRTIVRIYLLFTISIEQANICFIQNKVRKLVFLKMMSHRMSLPSIGGARRDRTDDPLLAKQVLSQLSYGP